MRQVNVLLDDRLGEPAQPRRPGLSVDGTPNAEHIQTLDLSSRVVKALNAVLVSRQAAPKVDLAPTDWDLVHHEEAL
jgi:hypothetical protein